MTSTTKNIEVKGLDNTKASEISDASKDSTIKEIHLSFSGLDGGIDDVNQSIVLLQEIHASKIDVTASCKGNIGLASTLLLAGCKYGERKAGLALFCLNEDSSKPGKKRKSLTPNERNALEILGKLTGKRAKLKEKMLSGETFISTEAKSLGIIDESTLFVDKYAEERKAPKKDKGKDKKKDSESKDDEFTSEKGKDDKEQKPDSKK